MFKLIFFCPPDHAEHVKEAIFATGAGQLGHYQQCSFETLGTGQFTPRNGATPYQGKLNKLEKVIEVKVEILCHPEFIAAAITALKASHPYEVPAYEVIKLENW